jgi:hypothetical protein
MSEPVIIEAAINGAAKAHNPNVPITEDELVPMPTPASTPAHHPPPPGGGRPERRGGGRAVPRRLAASAGSPGCAVVPTINIGPHDHWYDHIAPLGRSGLLRMSLSDPGSVNFGRRRDGLPSGSYVYTNSSTTSPARWSCATSSG